jgi:hypothetical protein
MRQLAWRPFPSGRHNDATGRLRLIVPVRNWDDYVRLAFEEIRLAGARQPQITRRLRAAVEDVRRSHRPNVVPSSMSSSSCSSPPCGATTGTSSPPGPPPARICRDSADSRAVLVALL